MRAERVSPITRDTKAKLLLVMKTTPTNTTAIKPIVLSATLKDALLDAFRDANRKTLAEGGCPEDQYNAIGEDTPEGEALQVFSDNSILGTWQLSELLRARGVDVDHEQLFESDAAHQIVYDDPDNEEAVIILNPSCFHFLLTK
jgi:hypothetical protein